MTGVVFQIRDFEQTDSNQEIGTRRKENEDFLNNRIFPANRTSSL